MNKTQRSISAYMCLITSTCILTACNHDDDGFSGGCYKVASHNPPSEPPNTPHTEIVNRFCLEKEGDNWFFAPGAGMDEWAAISGEEKIPMELVQENPSNILWTVNAKITPHVPLPGKTPHEGKHENEWGFRVRVHDYDDPPNSHVKLINQGGNSAGAHGGSAHANWD